MSKQEPKKHHYIPRFILKNFNNENGQVNYWNIEKDKLEKRNTKSVFMNIDMYRDEFLNHEDPTQIESKLSIFEREIAELISNKILNKEEIILDRRELGKLRIFTALLSFRSNHRMKQYSENLFDGSTRQILLKYQPDGNFKELWKREIDDIATCRCQKDIENSKTIDPIVKQEFLNSMSCFYMTFVDTQDEEFILTDIYPTLEVFPIDANINLHMHYLFPLTPTRMLILNHSVYRNDCWEYPTLKNMMLEYSQIKGNAIIPSINKRTSNHLLNPNDKFIYHVRKICRKDVEYINALFLNEAKVGFIFRNKNKILNSVISFNNRNDTKQKFISLEKKINKKNK